MILDASLTYIHQSGGPIVADIYQSAKQRGKYPPLSPTHSGE